VARRFGHRATLLGVVVAGLLFPASALAVTTITFPAADGDITAILKGDDKKTVVLALDVLK